VHGTLHYGDDNKPHTYRGKSYILPKGDFSEDFHVFQLDWEPTRIRWYVDGRRYQTQARWHTDGHPFPAPFDQRFHLLLNLAVGGNWPGPPDESSVFPQSLVVDYVRVYQKPGDSTLEITFPTWRRRNEDQSTKRWN
jgi:beta-glucanase (GH16 family)